jgi:hypothetical protein
MNALLRNTLLTALVALLGCGRGTPPAPLAVVPAGTIATSGNSLRMKVDGVEWRADHDVFGAFHPPGYDRALLIAGGKGPKDASEQVLNINLFGIDGPGRYAIRGGNPSGSVAQLANHTPERFLAGSMMGFDLVVEITVARTDPTHIEASFSGTLTGNDGVAMKIEDGRFLYRD